MVLLDTNDNTTLYFIDSTGRRVSADPISDWVRYTAFSQTQSDQNKVAGVNANREVNYSSAIGYYNAAVLAGRTPDSPPPNKPTMLVVSDPVLTPSGIWTPGIHSEVPFSHPLQDPAVAPTPYPETGPAYKLDTPDQASNTDLLKILVGVAQSNSATLAKIAAKLAI